MRSAAGLALATITTEAYVPATLVMLHSFMKRNPWFHGDVVIIHDDLDPASRQYFETILERVKFFPVSQELKANLRPLFSLRPDLREMEARFYALEVFRLRGYQKVLFYDGDILFRSSVQDLCERRESLVCCGEGLYYVDGCRDGFSLAELRGGECRRANVLRNTFNTGFLMVDARLLTDESYGGLLGLLAVETWKPLRVRMTDQAVFNLYFSGQQTLVSSHYNYLLRQKAEIRAKEGTGFTEAKVLHYNGPIKPWKAGTVLPAAASDPGLVKACAFWTEAYWECLQALHFKSRLPGLWATGRPS